MDWIEAWLISFVASENNPTGLGIIAVSALVEYIFPPFPGDAVTLFGAILITAYGWSFVGVFGAVMAGSCAGAMLDYYLGRRLSGTKRSKSSASLQRLVAAFERRGPAYLILNRFFPGIRALFFVAAGIAGMRPRSVLLYSALSAALWNLLLIGAGSLLGANFDTLKRWVGRYMVAAWIAIAIVAVMLAARAIIARRERRNRGESRR